MTDHCPDISLCSKDSCKKEKVCMSAEYWLDYWKARAIAKKSVEVAWEDQGQIIHIVHCCYCGVRIEYFRDLTVEHLVPRSAGGNNEKANKRDCCSKCNSERGNKELKNWVAEMRKELESDTCIESRVLIMTRIKNALVLDDYIEKKGSALYRSVELYKTRQNPT